MSVPPSQRGDSQSSNWSFIGKENLGHQGRITYPEQDQEARKHNVTGQLRLGTGDVVYQPEGLWLPRSEDLALRDLTTTAVHHPLVAQHTPTPYFRPQATLHHPLHIEFHGSAPSMSSEALVLRSSDQELTRLGPPQTISKDEQLALILSEHPELDFEEALRRLEGAEADVHCISSRQNDLQLAMRPTSVELGVIQPRDSSSGIISPRKLGPIDIRNKGIQRDSTEQYSKHGVAGNRHASPHTDTRSLFSSIDSKSITPSESASQAPQSAVEQEDEDFKLALELSRRDIARPNLSPSFNAHDTTVKDTSATGRDRKRVDYNLTATNLGSQNNPVPAVFDIASSTRSVSASSLQHLSPLPLFPDSAASSLIDLPPNFINPIVEQQRVADLTALQNLRAQRSTHRNAMEQALLAQMAAPPSEDRAAVAQLALARENLSDLQLSTHMSNVSLTQQRVGQLRRLANEDELARIQRLAAAEDRHRRYQQETALQRQEALEKARMRDRKHQEEAEERRIQEERDMRMAMEMSRMEHENILEKVDAMGRAANVDSRRPLVHQPRSYSLGMSNSNCPVHGESRAITYSEEPSWSPGEDEPLLQDSDHYSQLPERDIKGKGRNHRRK